MNYCKLVVSSIALTGLVGLPSLSNAESLAGSRADTPVQEWPVNYSRGEIRTMLLEALPASSAGTESKYQTQKMYSNKDVHEEDEMKTKSQQRAYEYKRQTFDEHL